MKRILTGLWIVGLLLGLAGCAAAAPKSTGARTASAPAQPPAAPVFAGETAVQDRAQNAVGAIDTERMIIRTADLSMTVTDAEPTLKSITAIVTQAGGYVADSRTWREREQVRAHVSVRIPADKLESVLETVKGLAVRVEGENISGKDVTEEFSDLSAQLVNLEATEIELRELLTEVRQKTQKAEDVLKVYQELTKVRGEIERIKGRMQYLSNQTALATANIELIPDVLAKPVVEPGWRPLETLKNAGRALVNTLKGLVDILIWLIIYLLPVLIVLAIPITLLVLALRRLTRRRRRRPAADDKPTPSAPIKE